MLSNFLFKKCLPVPLLLCRCSKSWSGVTGSWLPCVGWLTPGHLLCWWWMWDVWHVLPLPLSCQVEGSAAPQTQDLHGFMQRPGVPWPPAFNFHMIHIVWGFNSRSPGEHSNSVAICWFIQHIFVRCLLCIWQFTECWEFKDEGSTVSVLGASSCLVKIW